MRIIPYELYPYAPDLALTALRKEHGMHDYCLSQQRKNIAMQPFLDLGYDYFNLLVVLWVKEMRKRNFYVNSFHQFYADQHQVTIIATNFWLIMECCLQWDVKGFTAYNHENWFAIISKLIKTSNFKITNWNITTYHNLKHWYQITFMQVNKSGNLKPVKLNMEQVISHLQATFSIKS